MNHIKKLALSQLRILEEEPCQAGTRPQGRGPASCRWCLLGMLAWEGERTTNWRYLLILWGWRIIPEVMLVWQGLVLSPFSSLPVSLWCPLMSALNREQLQSWAVFCSPSPQNYKTEQRRVVLKLRDNMLITVIFLNLLPVFIQNSRLSLYL